MLSAMLAQQASCIVYADVQAALHHSSAEYRAMGRAVPEDSVALTVPTAHARGVPRTNIDTKSSIGLKCTLSAFPFKRSLNDLHTDVPSF